MSFSPLVLPHLPSPSRRVGRAAAVLVAVLAVLVVQLAAPAPASAATKAPSGLAVSTDSATSLDVRWKAVSGAPRYRVQYSTKSTMKAARYKRVTGTSTRVTGLRAGTRYYVKVRVITDAGVNLSAYSKAKSASTSAGRVTATGQDLRLGSFNVKCFNCKGSHPNERSWWDRRNDVVSTIRSQDVDVVGIQEASQAWLPASEGGKGQDLSQFEDLRDRLGGGWKVTNANRNNCVRPKTPTRCQYKDQGASKGTRILYDDGSVELLDQGSKLLPSPEDDRFMAWAVFRQRSSGKKFFFVTAHLEPDKNWALHRDEAEAIVREIDKRNTAHLPTFITGDMNSHKNSTNAQGQRDNAVFRVLVNDHGYVDPLGNPSGSTTQTPGATVEKRVQTYLSSFNDFMPVPNPMYYGRRTNGTYIDYIFTSRGVRVKEWENVANLDAAHHYAGKQASDHNMQRATVVLS